MRTTPLILGLLGVVSALSGCASLTTIAMQPVSVETTPAGAECDVRQNGAAVATAVTTPATIQAPRSAYPLDITCRRNGYLETAYEQPSVAGDRLQPQALMNSLIGLATAGSVNARNGYASKIQIAMTPDPALPATLKDVKPVASVAVQRLETPVAQ